MTSSKLLFALSLSIVSIPLFTTVVQSNHKVLAQNTKDNFLIYKDPKSGITVSYPSYWSKIQKENSLSFISPLKTVGVKFTVIPAANMSLDEFTTKQIIDLRGSNLTNFNIDSLYGAQYLSNPAQLIIFFYGNQGNMHKVLRGWTVKDNKAYIFTYFADSVLYGTFLPVAVNIIDSFQLNAPAIANSSANRTATQ